MWDQPIELLASIGFSAELVHVGCTLQSITGQYFLMTKYDTRRQSLKLIKKNCLNGHCTSYLNSNRSKNMCCPSLSAICKMYWKGQIWKLSSGICLFFEALYFLTNNKNIMCICMYKILSYITEITYIYIEREANFKNLAFNSTELNCANRCWKSIKNSEYILWMY